MLLINFKSRSYLIHFFFLELAGSINALVVTFLYLGDIHLTWRGGGAWFFGEKRFLTANLMDIFFCLWHGQKKYSENTLCLKKDITTAIKNHSYPLPFKLMDVPLLDSLLFPDPPIIPTPSRGSPRRDRNCTLASNDGVNDPICNSKYFGNWLFCTCQTITYISVGTDCPQIYVMWTNVRQDELEVLAEPFIV